MSQCNEMTQRRCVQHPNNKIYLFIESFEYLQNREILRDELRALRLRAMCTQNGEKPVSESGDPILHYVLGYAKMPSVDTLLDFCWKSAQSRSDLTVLLDLCLYFNASDRARRIADEMQFNHQMMPKIDRINSLDDSSCSSKWVEWIKNKQIHGGTSAQCTETDAELSSFLLHFVRGDRHTAVCQMAARGYAWDAFVLMSFISPEHELVAVLRSLLWKKYNLDWIDEEMSRPITGTFDSLSQLGLNSESVFRVLFNTFEGAGGDQLAKMTANSNMRVCLLSAIIEASDAGFANAMMQHYFHLISQGHMSHYWFPFQNRCFKKTFAVMSDIIYAIVRLSNSFENDLASSLKDDSSCVLTSLWRRWIEQGTIPPDPSSAEVCMGISGILGLFKDDVLSIDNIFIGGVDYKFHILLSLRIAEVLFKKALIHNHSSLIYELLCKCDMNEDHLERLLWRGVEKSLNNSIADSSLASIKECFQLVGRRFKKENYFSTLQAYLKKSGSPAIVSPSTDLEPVSNSLNTTQMSNSASYMKNHDPANLSTFGDVPTDGNTIVTPRSDEKELKWNAQTPGGTSNDDSRLTYGRDTGNYSPATPTEAAADSVDKFNSRLRNILMQGADDISFQPSSIYPVDRCGGGGTRSRKKCKGQGLTFAGYSPPKK